MYSLEKLLLFILTKKLIKSGKQRKSLRIQKYLIILKKQHLLLNAVSNLMLPVKFRIKKIGCSQYYIPILIHYYVSIKLALSWLIKAAKLKSLNKMPFVKALCLECYDVLKEQGISYKYREQYLKKALTNRMFIHLITSLKKK